MPPPHRIRRQSWQVRTGSAAEGFAARQRLLGAWEELILPAFERAFDRVAGGEGVVRVPRLEIRVSAASLEALLERLPELIEAESVEQLLAAVGGAGAEPGRPPAAGEAAAAEERFTALLHYLRTGSLPWTAGGTPAGEAAEELRAAYCADPERVARALRARREPAAAYFRLLHLLHEEELPRVASALAASLPPAWSDALLRLAAPADPAPPVAALGRYARLTLAAALLAEAAVGSAPPAPERLAAVLREAAGAGAAERVAVEALLAPLAGGGDAPAGEPAQGGARTPREAPSGPPRAPRTGADAPGRAGEAGPGGEPPAAAGRAPAPGAVESWPGEVQPGEVPHAAVAETPRGPGAPDGGEYPFAVPDAGLVLLHPYLVPFFQHTGVLVDGRVPEHALPRAAALLHHLATGREEIHEFELGLARVLLGLGPSDPLPVAEGLLREGDAEEAAALLGAVIAHWPVLRNTSVEGLRGSFLERRGLLRREDRGWRLWVEPASYDMLLSHLPWGLSIVKLPWMPDPVHVEWPTR